MDSKQGKEAGSRRDERLAARESRKQVILAQRAEAADLAQFTRGGPTNHDAIASG